MLQENLAFFKCCNVKCCKLFRGTKIVANSNVANFLGKFALLQKPIVAKKKPMKKRDKNVETRVSELRYQNL